MLTRYVDHEEPTALNLEPYLDTEEPTLEMALSKSDAVYEAHEGIRAGNLEAAGAWLWIAGSL